jgi:hypothetical protein
VTPTESELLTSLHRIWIETRNPKDGDRFAKLIAELVRQDEKNRFPSFPEERGGKL